MDIGNIIGSLIEYTNSGAELSYLVKYLSGVILENLPWSLPRSSVGMSYRLFLGNWTGSLLVIFPGTLLGVPLGLQVGSEENMYC